MASRVGEIMKSLPIRIVSALFAVALLFGTGYFGGQNGLAVLGAVVFAIGVFEYAAIAFSSHLPPVVKKPFEFTFLLFGLVLLFSDILALYVPVDLLTVWASIIVMFVTCVLWLVRGRVENAALFTSLALAILGFFYAALLPTFVLRLLFLHNGIAWFALLAVVVFAGDTFAFFGGILLGKNKLMPSLSPSKTVAGSVSGVSGSTLAGLLVGILWLPNVPLVLLILTSLVASFIAQNGDLFESLIKRVANIKDSGRIMPGHGGVLDRLDGIYFAAPIIFAAALLCQ